MKPSESLTKKRVFELTGFEDAICPALARSGYVGRSPEQAARSLQGSGFSPNLVPQPLAVKSFCQGNLPLHYILIPTIPYSLFSLLSLSFKHTCLCTHTRTENWDLITVFVLQRKFKGKGYNSNLPLQPGKKGEGTDLIYVHPRPAKLQITPPPV